MELRQIRHAISVATTGSFSKSAQLESVSVRAVKSSIDDLEGSLGVQLFHRMGDRVVPTAAGSHLVARGKSILHECALLKSTVMGTRFEVTIPSATSEVRSIVDPIVRGGLVVEARLVLCVSLTHPLAKCAATQLSVVANEPLVSVRGRDNVCKGMQQLTRMGIRPSVVYETDDLFRAFELIRASIGVGVIAPMGAVPGIVQVPLQEFSTIHSLQ